MTSTGPSAPYALARFRTEGAIALGVVAADRIRAISADELGAADLNAFLGDPDWDRIAALAEREDGWMPLADVTLTAPVQPRQVLQAGANYRQHVIELVAAGLTNNTDRTPEQARDMAAEMMDQRALNGEPYFFIGLPTCVVGDDVPLALPPYSKVHDWELELAVVIGREAFRVSREDALDHVAGYTIVNDITTRDLVFRKDMKEIGTDWYRAKNAPGFLPAGPVPGACPVRGWRQPQRPSRAQRRRDAGRRRPTTCSSTSRRSSRVRRRPCRSFPATSC